MAFIDKFLVSLVAALAFAGPLAAHEFWIDAEQYQVDSGSQVTARFRNGENFTGIELAYFPARSRQLSVLTGEARIEVEPRMGDRPAIVVPEPADGLMVIIHETQAASVTYKTWDDFAAFAAHKDFPDILARHKARLLPMEGFSETYTRHAKALIAVGTGTGSDRQTGMETEFVALANPYVDDIGADLPVRLFHRDAPRADAQVEIFDRAPDGHVVVTRVRTGPDGRATIPVRRGHTYLLDAVVLGEVTSGDAAWTTAWASLTFAVP